MLRVRGTFQRKSYDFQYACEIVVQFRVPESHHLETFFFEKPRSCRIIGQSSWLRVLAAVEFNDQVPFETNKIDNIDSDRLLAAKFVRVEAAIPKREPELAFDLRLFAAQPPGQFVFQQGVPLTRFRAEG